MIVRWRSLMIWPLLLALPVQRFAAATTVNCGPTHHRMSGASMATHDGHAHHGEHADHDLNTLARFKCSACAACSMGAVLLPSPLAFLASPPAVAPDASVIASPFAFLTNGPDRPRSFLV